MGRGAHREPVRDALVADLVDACADARPAREAVDVRTVGAAASPDLRVARLRQTGADLLDELGLPPRVAEDLLARALPPSLDDLLALADAVVEVAPPAAEQVVEVADLAAVDVLEQPARLARTFRALVPVVARWEVLVAPRGAGALTPPGHETLTALRELTDRLEALDRVLADPATGLHLVPAPGPAGDAERAAAVVALALMGRTPTAVHDRPLTGAPGPGRRSAGEATHDAGARHPAPQPAAPGPRVRREGERWWFELDVPGLRAGDVDLVRHEDELVLGCAGRHRSLTLPPVLRRCQVERAGLRRGVLTLELTPDEELWPR